MTPVIIIAPAGLGKSLKASSLMRAFGCTRLVEEWNGVAPLRDGEMVLTNIDHVLPQNGCRVVALSDALKSALAV